MKSLSAAFLVLRFLAGYSIGWFGANIVINLYNHTNLHPDAGFWCLISVVAFAALIILEETCKP